MSALLQIAQLHYPVNEIAGYCSHATIPRGVLACICQNPETYGADLCV